jgi:hypothetical protein
MLFQQQSHFKPKKFDKPPNPSLKLYLTVKVNSFCRSLWPSLSLRLAPRHNVGGFFIQFCCSRHKDHLTVVLHKKWCYTPICGFSDCPCIFFAGLFILSLQDGCTGENNGSLRSHNPFNYDFCKASTFTFCLSRLSDFFLSLTSLNQSVRLNPCL